VVEEEEEEEDISRALESIRENIKASATGSLDYYELKQHKSWFDEEYSKLLEQRKQVNCNGCRVQVRQMEVL